MLGDDVAALVDQSLGVGGFLGGVGPLVGVVDEHGHVGVDALGAQIEGGVAGDDLGEGLGSHIAELVGLGLQTGSDTGQVTGLEDLGEVVVGVVQGVGSALVAGGVAELHVGVVGSGLLHVLLVAEGVGEDGVAAGIEQLVDGVGAGGVLGDVGLHDDLGVIVHAVLLAGLSHAVDVVLVVGIGGLTDQDQADLQLVGSDAGGGSGVAAAVGGGVSIGAGVAAAAGGQAQGQSTGHEQSKNTLFHLCSS